MALNFVSNPYSYYNARNKGKPIFNGEIFIGKPDLDPTIVANQLEVTAKQEDGTKVPISQPISTNSGGYAVDASGNIVVLLVDGNYAIQVNDSQGNLALKQADVNDGVPITLESNTVVFNYDTLNDAVISTTLVDGQALNIKERTTGNGGGAMWDVVLSSTVTENTYDIVQGTGVGTLSLVLRIGFSVNVDAFGADDIAIVADSTAAVERAFIACAGIAKCTSSPKTYGIDAGLVRAGNSLEGVRIPSDSYLEFHAGTIWMHIPSPDIRASVFHTYLATNVVVKGNGATVRGDLITFTGTREGTTFQSTEFRIEASNDIFIYDLKCIEGYTDGFGILYDHLNSPSPESTNVQLINCSGTANQRNGGAVIGCIGGSIQGGNWSNNTGAPPQAGIDIEPNAIKPDGEAAIVADFEVTGAIANSNGTQGIVADGAGTITNLKFHHNTTRNNLFGIVAHNCFFSQVNDNVSYGNTSSDLLVWGTETCLVDSNSTGQLPTLSISNAININERTQAVMLAASGVVTGVKVLDDSAINFGTADFTIFCQVGQGDWTPASETYLYWKTSGVSPNITGVLLAITPTGQIRLYLYRNDDGTTFTTVAGNYFANDTINSIGVSVLREVAGTAGGVSFYINGVLSESVSIDAAAVVTLTNTGNLHIGGRSTTSQQEIALKTMATFSSVLIPQQHIDLYRDGIAETDKWSNCTFALEPEGIQPPPGLWLDSSTNNNHGRHPTSLSTLARPMREFEISWANTWAGTSELQYLGDVDTPILSASNVRITSISNVGTAAGANVTYGDGSAADYWVSAAAVINGFSDYTLAKRNHDGTNRDLSITPSGNYTGTITTTVRGIII